MTESVHARRLGTMLTLAALVVVFTFLLAPAAHAVTVTFPDANLEDAVRDMLSKPTGDITDADMLRLGRLYAYDRGITNLEGLEYATNLGFAHLEGNQITDLTPLSGLTDMYWLNLGGNQIDDLGPLAGLTKMWYLNLNFNQITDLTPLAGMTVLGQLYLGNNQISDVTPLKDATDIAYLWLAVNQIDDISPLAGMRLLRLNLAHNLITDITPLLGADEMTLLYVHDNYLDLTLGEPAMTAITTLESRGVYVGYTPQLVPYRLAVYRFYDKRTGSHFYTASEAEKNSVKANLSATYLLEGAAFRTLSDYATPLHRFYDRRTGAHFYTASEAEKNDVIANLSDIYSYDGVAWVVSASPVEGTVPVYRFYNRRNGSHFYTASEAEKDSTVVGLSAVYALDGVAFYVMP